MMMLLSIVAIYAVSVGLGCGIGWAIAAPIVRRIDAAMKSASDTATAGAGLTVAEHVRATG
jgi:hypothetical protein